MWLLPASYTIPRKLILMSEDPVASGSSYDVREGIHNDKRVAVKVLHVWRDEEMRKVRKVTDPAFLVPLGTSVDYRH